MADHQTGQTSLPGPSPSICLWMLFSFPWCGFFYNYSSLGVVLFLVLSWVYVWKRFFQRGKGGKGGHFAVAARRFLFFIFTSFFFEEKKPATFFSLSFFVIVNLIHMRSVILEFQKIHWKYIMFPTSPPPPRIAKHDFFFRMVTGPGRGPERCR